MRTLNRTVLSLLSFLCYCTAIEARGLVVSPAQLLIAGKAGDTISAAIYIASSQERQSKVQATLIDFLKDEQGNFQEFKSNDHFRSNRTWLEVDRTEFITPKNGRIPLRVTARIPKNASGSYWAAVTIKSGQMPRISIPVVVTVQGTEQPDVAFSAPEVVQSANGLLECQSVVENKGNTAVLIRGAFSLEKQISSEETEELQIAEVGPVTSLPGTRMKIKANLNWAESMDGLQVNSYLRYGPGARDIAIATGR
jgi:hypothetical protein